MWMSGGSSIGAHRRWLAALALGMLTGAVPAVWAQPVSMNIADDEMNGFVDRVFEAYNTCDASWFHAQLSPSASIQVSYASGEMTTFSSDEYVAKLRKICRPYQLVKWDQSSFQVKTGSTSASAVWKMAWGGRPGLAPQGSSALIFTNSLQVAREERGLQITGLELRADELVPGAEKAYWSQTALSGLLDMAIAFYDGILIRMRDWRTRSGLENGQP